MLTLGPGTTFTGHTEFSGAGTNNALINQGTIAQTTIFGAFINGQSGFTFTNNGTVTNSADTLLLSNGSNNSVTNNGVITATGGTIQIGGTATSVFTNTATGIVSANGGTVTLGNGGSSVTNLSGNTPTGGTWRAQTGGTLSFEGTTNAIVTNAANLVLDGTGSTIRTRTGPASTYQSLGQTLATNNGSLAVIGNRNFTATNALANNGTLQLGGGTLAAPALANNASGTLTGFGTVSVRPTNQGTIQASGGTLTFANGIQGPGGTINVAPGATLNLAGGSSGTSTGYLQQNGTLALGTNNLAVATDYTNANFGTGNTFNPRAGVSGTGEINAAGNTAQTLTGDKIFNGASATPTLNFGSFREGQLVRAAPPPSTTSLTDSAPAAWFRSPRAAMSSMSAARSTGRQRPTPSHPIPRTWATPASAALFPPTWPSVMLPAIRAALPKPSAPPLPARRVPPLPRARSAA